MSKRPSDACPQTLRCYSATLPAEHRRSRLYRELLDQYVGFVEPRNVIEWLWVKDIVDLTWEIARLRRYRALLIERERESKNAEIDYAREHADDRNLSDGQDEAAADRGTSKRAKARY